MGAITDLWQSERGLLAMLLIVAVTVLACLGQVTFAEWREYTLYVYGAYAIAKTITGTAQVIKGGTADPESAKTSTATPVTAPSTPP